MWGCVGYLGRAHVVIYPTLATLGTKCTFPVLPYRIPPYPILLHILPYPILHSRLYPTPYHHILSIPLIPHVSLAFTYYSILPYHTLPHPTLNYFTLTPLKLDRYDPGQKRLRTETTRLSRPYHEADDKTESDSWPKVNLNIASAHMCDGFASNRVGFGRHRRYRSL